MVWRKAKIVLCGNLTKKCKRIKNLQLKGLLVLTQQKGIYKSPNTQSKIPLATIGSSTHVGLTTGSIPAVRPVSKYQQ